MFPSKKRESSCNAFNRKKVKYFSYEEEFYCKHDFQGGSKDLYKLQSIYLVIGGLILVASICLLGFDLFLHRPLDGVATIDYERQESVVQERRHTNTPASSLPSTPPVLAPMEYWL